MAVRIPLRNGGHTLIDDEDEKRVKKHGWYSTKGKATTYVRCMTKSHHKLDYTKNIPELHRFITKAPKGTVVDHINGDGLDNRKSNLHVGTNSDNMRNTKRHRVPADATERMGFITEEFRQQYLKAS